MSIYIKKDELDKSKVYSKFIELKNMPPETASLTIEEISRSRIWSERECKELLSLYRTHRIAVERDQERKQKKKTGI